MSFPILSVDLGQSQDYTAVTVLEANPTQYKQTVEVLEPEYGVLTNRTVLVDALPVSFGVRHLDRLQLGTSYPEIIRQIQHLLKRLAGNALLVVDRTGVGRPVTDHLEMAGLEPIAITITGGQRVTAEPDNWRHVAVPKRDLVSSLVMASQQRRIKIAKGLPLHPVILKELLAFEMRLTASGNETFEGRVGQHDDLVMALATGVWAAEAVVNTLAAQAVAENEMGDPDAGRVHIG